MWTPVIAVPCTTTHRAWLVYFRLAGQVHAVPMPGWLVVRNLAPDAV